MQLGLGDSVGLGQDAVPRYWEETQWVRTVEI